MKEVRRFEIISAGTTIGEERVRVELLEWKNNGVFVALRNVSIFRLANNSKCISKAYLRCL